MLFLPLVDCFEADLDDDRRIPRNCDIGIKALATLARFPTAKMAAYVCRAMDTAKIGTWALVAVGPDNTWQAPPKTLGALPIPIGWSFVFQGWWNPETGLVEKGLNDIFSESSESSADSRHDLNRPVDSSKFFDTRLEPDLHHGPARTARADQREHQQVTTAEYAPVNDDRV